VLRMALEVSFYIFLSYGLVQMSSSAPITVPAKRSPFFLSFFLHMLRIILHLLIYGVIKISYVISLYCAIILILTLGTLSKDYSP
jgi:hypothetical protein